MSRINNLVYTGNILRDTSETSGMYRARVEDVHDPLGIGRVKVRIPKFHGISDTDGFSVDSLPWATMVSNSAGFGYGSYIVPEVGEYVMVQFEDGDTQKPVYLGSLYGSGARKPKKYTSAEEEWESPTEQNEVPYDAQREDPSKKIIYKSPKGSEIAVDEMPGGESITISDTIGQRIVLESPNDIEASSHEERVSTGEASVSITGLNGQMVELHSTKSSTELSLICRECAVTLKPDSDGISILANNSCIMLDKSGNISISGGNVSLTANENIDIECEEEILIFGKHVTIGNVVTIIEGYGGGSGSGYQGIDYDPNLVDISELMKDVDTSDWDQVVHAMKGFMQQASGKYNQGGYVRFEYNGKTINIRTDCSGFVSGCLNVYGALNGMTSSAGLCATQNLKGFTKANFTDWSDLKKGDILVVNGHTEIFDGNRHGAHYVYNYGSDFSAGQAGSTKSGHDRYSYVFRPDGSINNTPNANETGGVSTGTQK